MFLRDSTSYPLAYVLHAQVRAAERRFKVLVAGGIADLTQRRRFARALLESKVQFAKLLALLTMYRQLGSSPKSPPTHPVIPRPRFRKFARSTELISRQLPKIVPFTPPPTPIRFFLARVPPRISSISISGQYLLIRSPIYSYSINLQTTRLASLIFPAPISPFPARFAQSYARLMDSYLELDEPFLAIDSLLLRLHLTVKFSRFASLCVRFSQCFGLISGVDDGRLNLRFANAFEPFNVFHISMTADHITVASPRPVFVSCDTPSLFLRAIEPLSDIEFRCLLALLQEIASDSWLRSGRLRLGKTREIWPTVDLVTLFRFAWVENWHRVVPPLILKSVYIRHGVYLTSSILPRIALITDFENSRLVWGVLESSQRWTVPLSEPGHLGVSIAFRTVILYELIRVLEKEQLGHVFPRHRDRITFTLPWVGNLVFKMRADLSWTLQIPAILSPERGVHAIRIYGPGIVSDFPNAFMRFLRGFLVLCRIRHNPSECELHLLELQIEMETEFLISARVKGPITSTLVGHLELWNMQQQGRDCSVISSVTRCFPFLYRHPYRNFTAFHFIRRLLVGDNDPRALISPNFAQCIALVAAICREVPGESWSVAWNSSLHLQLIFERRLTIAVLLSRSDRFCCSFPNRLDHLPVDVVFRSLSSVVRNECAQMISIEHLTFTDLMNVKRSVEQIVQNMRLAAEHGFTRPTRRELKSAVFLEGEFRFLTVIAVVSPEKVVLEPVGGHEATDMLRVFLELHQPCHKEVLPFVAHVAARPPAERTNLLANAISERRQNL
jgi:hypothetical protein